jgi:hypothetical protein
LTPDVLLSFSLLLKHLRDVPPQKNKIIDIDRS